MGSIRLLEKARIELNLDKIEAVDWSKEVELDNFNQLPGIGFWGLPEENI